jgi:hypothetical protein
VPAPGDRGPLPKIHPARSWLCPLPVARHHPANRI